MHQSSDIRNLSAGRAGALGRRAAQRRRTERCGRADQAPLRSAEDRHARAHQQRGALDAGRAAQSPARRGLHPFRRPATPSSPTPHADLSRPQSPRQPGGAPSDRARHQARRPRRASVRQVGRNLRGDAGGDEGQRRLRAARRRVSRSSASASSSATPRSARSSRCRASSSASRRSTSRRSSSTRRRRAIDAQGRRIR